MRSMELYNAPKDGGTKGAKGAGFRIRFSNFSGSGSGFKISLVPDPVFKLGIQIRFQIPDPGAKKKSTERALKINY